MSESNVRVLRKARAVVIDGESIQKRSAGSGKSHAVDNDPFASYHQKLVQPPYDLFGLSLMPERSTELQQCIEAMEIGIDGFGHRFVPRVQMKPGEDLPPELAEPINAEFVELTNFFQYATFEPFVQFRRKLRVDLEVTGNSYFEVIRNIAGDVQGFTHLPSYQMRLGLMDKAAHEVEMPILEMQLDRSVKVVGRPMWKRFRRFLQAKSVSTSLTDQQSAKHTYTWFKEYGDDRIYNRETGELADETLEMDKRANEVVHMRIYAARTPYGLPRYRGNILSISGDRAAEEVNLTTLENNNIPSMLLCVSNGQLTEESLGRVESFVESCIQGSNNYSKFIILEGESAYEGEDGGQIKIDAKPLTGHQHKDQLFQQYSENNQQKVRRSFRLPPIFVGRADDYTRATAQSSKQLADEQIFAPERELFDALFNRFIFPDLGIVYHKYRSNSPNTTDNTELVKILGGSEKTGGMTPRLAKIILEDILGMPLPPFKDGFDPDLPFSLTMAQAVKNQAQPNEPGQQVTALKVLGAGLEDESTGDPVIDHLVSVWKGLDDNWKRELSDHDHEH